MSYGSVQIGRRTGIFFHNLWKSEEEKVLHGPELLARNGAKLTRFDHSPVEELGKRAARGALAHATEAGNQFLHRPRLALAVAVREQAAQNGGVKWLPSWPLCRHVANNFYFERSEHGATLALARFSAPCEFRWKDVIME